MPQVVLNHVSKEYANGVLAVDDVSFDVNQGEFLVLVGPSGCGKSTALRLVAGLERLTSGRVDIADREVSDLPPRQRDVAMVFQNYALYPHMTVAKNMGFALKMRRIPKADIEKRVAEAAEMLGIKDLLNRKPKALSGGQQQRVALGRAIVRKPAAFLFDEPLSNLDAQLRLTMRTEIKALQRRIGTATIYVTHDQEEAMGLADRLAIMEQGQLQQLGTPMEAYTKPCNRFVASFIGSPTMNFLDGHLVQRDGKMFFCERAEGAEILVPEPHATALSKANVDQVVMAVRPQGLTPGQAPSMLTLQVQVAEALGESTDLIGVTSAGQPMIARVDARLATQVAQMPLAIDPDKLFFFEPGPFGALLASTA
jgi:multiple sugar transport system ATP-binding protein